MLAIRHTCVKMHIAAVPTHILTKGVCWRESIVTHLKTEPEPFFIIFKSMT